MTDPAAIGAGVDVTAQCSSPALLDGAHHPPLDTAQVSGMGTAIGIAVETQDIRHFQTRKHGAHLGGRHDLQLEPIERALGPLDQPSRNTRVARCARQIGMAEQDLNDPNVGAALQKMGGEAVPERMHRHPFGQTGRHTSRAAGGMQHLDVDRLYPGSARKQPVMRPGQPPIGAQD